MAGFRRTIIWWACLPMCLAAIVADAVVLALAIGAILDPTSSYYAMISSSLWTTYGPHLVALAVIATLVTSASWRWGQPWLARTGTALSVLSLTGATYIVGSIIAATVSAGGSVDPIAGLLLSKITEPPPDLSESFTNADGQNLRAAIYRPASRPIAAPVLVYIHGGGFMTGANTETAADLRWFADRGWVVFSIDYRLFTTGNPTWDKAPDDVACGLAWVYANAARFGGDSDRIALLGDSAGGNLAINLAYGAARGSVHSPCGPVPVPKALVVQYPAVDPIAIYERGYPVPGFEPKMLMAGYVGGTPQQFPDRIRAISSETYISDKAPPTLIIEPENDSLVVPDSVYSFVDKARAAGADVEMVRIPFANHVYNQIAANSIGNQARRTTTSAYLAKHALAP